MAQAHRQLAARWIGSQAGAEQRFLVDTGTLCVLGHYHDIPAVRVWNGHLLIDRQTGTERTTL